MTEFLEVAPGIFWIGVIDRTTDLFEGMWPISREGVTYNSYLVKGEKLALIDLAKASKADDLLRQIDGLADIRALDYIVINHMEPDHTGVLKLFHRLASNATILCSEKARDLLAAFYGITERVRVVRDGETLPLGKFELKFFETPFVHWPETMMTWVTPGNVLFSCDGFGGFGALDGTIFDDAYESIDFYEQEALRYFADIVSKYSRMVLKAIEKLSALPISVIAPSHGLVWRRRPERIIELYRQWSNYSIGPAKPEVTLLYATMYGATETMMNAVAHGITGAGVPLQIFDVMRTHVSYVLSSLCMRQGVMVGAPTYEGQLFPGMASFLEVLKIKHIVNKQAAYFGSYGWSGGGQSGFQKAVEPMQWEIRDTLAFRGNPTGELLKQGEAFGERFARTIKNPEKMEEKTHG
jgi:anaerobic nitric oxide reductase flavorubredoxin